MCSRLYKKSEVKESLNISLNMSTGLLERMPSSWKVCCFNLSHQSFDSSAGIIYNFDSWGDFLVTAEVIPFDIFVHPEDMASCLTTLFLFFIPIPCSLFQVLCYEDHDICHWNFYVCCLQCFVFSSVPVDLLISDYIEYLQKWRAYKWCRAWC